VSLKGDPGTTRALNRRLVLNQLRRNGPMSRSAITAAIGLSPAAVTFVTAALIHEGLLIEGKAIPRSSGRRPVPLDIDYASRLSIGLQVYVARIAGVITDLSTRVLAEVSIPLPDHRPETVVEISARAAEGLLAKARVNRRRLIGIGLAVAGQVDAEAGLCRQMQRFGWRNVPIAAMLADAVAVPVWVDNDANAYAVQQQLFGHARGLQTIAAVAIGRGIGAGLVIDGRLHRGAGGAAGEFGHNFDERGRICECGRDGCLETYCSDAGMVLTWNTLDPQTRGKGVDDLAAAARAGDTIAGRVLAEAGTRLGRHVAALVNLFDPEMIVFGGEGMRFGHYLLDPLRRVLAEVCYPGAPRIAVDSETTGWSRGAAALAVQHFFNFEVTGGLAPKQQSLRPQRVA
jgi:predicted NBD/HSP70 family sugar kinase